MKLTKIKSLLLKEHIKYIYLLKSESQEEIPEGQGHLPDGTFEVIFSYGSPVYHSSSKGGFLRRADAIFIGGYKKFHQVKYTGKLHLIGVVFDQAAISGVVGDRMNQSQEFFTPAEFVFNHEINLVAEQLSDTEDMFCIRSIVEDYFVRLIKPEINYQANRISLAMDMMHNSQGRIKVKTLTDQLCMSERNFRRVFSETTGYSPREMLTIIRTKRLIHLLKNNNSIRDAARLLAYYDASHVIHDFKALTGTTPGDYLSRMNIIDLNFFEKSEYAG